MSVKVMGQVWELADLTPAEQHVLLAYADHADRQSSGGVSSEAGAD